MPALPRIGKSGRAMDAWPIAEYYVGRMTDVENESKLFYSLAALPHGYGRPGYPEAQYRLGRIFENGKELDKAEMWYLEAAKQRDGGPGHPGSQFRLGCMYEKGWPGRRRDPDRAEEWYRKARRSALVRRTGSCLCSVPTRVHVRQGLGRLCGCEEGDGVFPKGCRGSERRPPLEVVSLVFRGNSVACTTNSVACTRRAGTGWMQTARRR